MKCISTLLFITIFGGIWRLGRPTCVLESDFGFILNCAFKKSSLFRVRNLGGVKAHIGLGFSVGDELGFKESLSNVETNRRRSTSASKLQAQLIQAQQNAKKMSNSLTVRSPSASVSSRSDSSSHQIIPPLASGAVRETLKKSLATQLPPFKPIPPADERPALPPSISQPSLMGIAVPAFSAMPSSISRFSVGNPGSPKVMAVVAVPKKQSQLHAMDKIGSSHFADRTLPSLDDLPEPIPQHSSNSIQALLAANNVTEETLEAALLQRQQQLLLRRATSTTTTTYRPTSKYANSVGKVMNAPKEYYPVGYDKNFDDNFASRVDLPETSFYCGDQKHFPGLYADEDLGCMVFHVCALTDDGLIMKSFLCPESTLFDNTVLKCNWWFYVDCKNSKKHYDSNIPISKSYQLMKALTFFSEYKKDSTTQKSNEKD
ncbi:unnamed protein product [Phaedon cochleariae]|uniref:Chitin-binding type-2 domain-containing protein n=1 Tax=Phaedon cochleariae TaxID=80249 RepID=A0A9N9SEI5_PHACE|nr:unnamed protein product [Phaedon cochleariae]